MSLKEQINTDIRTVFLNDADFAGEHSVNGSPVICLIDKDNTHMRAGAARRVEGVREDSQFLYIDAHEFKTPPLPHAPIEIDGKQYVIRTVSAEMGLLVIEYAATVAAPRVSLGAMNRGKIS